MSSGQYFENKGERPTNGRYFGFDHIKFLVGNAMQAADWYIGRFGFKRVAYSGLETGSRQHVHHVLQHNKIFFVFVSALNPDDESMGPELIKHGDGVKDVAFTVDDCAAIYKRAVERGAKSVQEPKTLTDEFGTVVIATVQTYGDTTHSFVERKNYTGRFMPGFKSVDEEDPFEKLSSPVGLSFVDHCVGNQPLHAMEPLCQWYEKSLEFHRFWSVDDSVIHTEYSSLKSIVMTDFDEVIKMPINEPAVGKRKSQIQEFVEYFGGPGVQHIALNTPDIVAAVQNLRARGVRFLSVPSTYYTALKEKLAHAPIKVKEDLDVLEQLKILIDFDDKGYLLQLFTKPVEDRPTLFIEIIQRNNHQGFGAGNFKSLFEAIEREQELRGNL
jgi:4-hydroxyphenylpyruvate dioxygenase